MMPAIAPRPAHEPVMGNARKDGQARSGDDAFGALLDAPATERQPAETKPGADDATRTAGPNWSLPFALLGGDAASTTVSVTPEPEDTASEDTSTEAETDQPDGLADLVLPSTLVLQVPPRTAMEEAAVKVENATATAEADMDMSTAEVAQQASGNGDENRLAKAIPADPSRLSSATAQGAATGQQASPARPEPKKSAAIDAVPAGNTSHGRPEVLSVNASQGTAPAPAPATADAVTAWDAARAGSDAEPESGDEPKAVQAQPVATAAASTQPSAPVALVSAPAPLALDPAEQPALVQAARNVTAAEIDQQSGANTTDRLTLQLKPINLGSVTAVLHASDGSLSVELHVENAEAHQRLSNEKDAIGKALRDIGLDVGVITVQQAVQPAQAIDRDQSGPLSNGNGSKNDSASWSAGEGRRNDGSTAREGGSDRGAGGGGGTARSTENGRERAAGGRYI